MNSIWDLSALPEVPDINADEANDQRQAIEASPNLRAELTRRNATSVWGKGWQFITGHEVDEQTYELSPKAYKPYVDVKIQETIEQIKNADFRGIEDQDKYRQWFGGTWNKMTAEEFDLAIQQGGGYEAFLKDFYLQGYDEAQEKEGEKRFLIPEVERLRGVEQYWEGRGEGVGVIDHVQNYITQPANAVLIAGETAATWANPLGWAYRGGRLAWAANNAWKARGVSALGWGSRDAVVGHGVERFRTNQLVEAGIMTQEEADKNVELATYLAGAVGGTLGVFKPAAKAVDNPTINAAETQTNDISVFRANNYKYEGGDSSIADNAVSEMDFYGPGIYANDTLEANASFLSKRKKTDKKTGKILDDKEGYSYEMRVGRSDGKPLNLIDGDVDVTIAKYNEYEGIIKNGDMPDNIKQDLIKGIKNIKTRTEEHRKTGFGGFYTWLRANVPDMDKEVYAKVFREAFYKAGYDGFKSDTKQMKGFFNEELIKEVKETNSGIKNAAGATNASKTSGKTQKPIETPQGDTIGEVQKVIDENNLRQKEFKKTDDETINARTKSQSGNFRLDMEVKKKNGETDLMATAQNVKDRLSMTSGKRTFDTFYDYNGNLIYNNAVAPSIAKRIAGAKITNEELGKDALSVLGRIYQGIKHINGSGEKVTEFYNKMMRGTAPSQLKIARTSKEEFVEDMVHLTSNTREEIGVMYQQMKRGDFNGVQPIFKEGSKKHGGDAVYKFQKKYGTSDNPARVMEQTWDEIAREAALIKATGSINYRQTLRDIDALLYRKVVTKGDGKKVRKDKVRPVPRMARHYMRAALGDYNQWRPDYRLFGDVEGLNELDKLLSKANRAVHTTADVIDVGVRTNYLTYTAINNYMTDTLNRALLPSFQVRGGFRKKLEYAARSGKDFLEIYSQLQTGEKKQILEMIGIIEVGRAQNASARMRGFDISTDQVGGKLVKSGERAYYWSSFMTTFGQKTFDDTARAAALEFGNASKKAWDDLTPYEMQRVQRAEFTKADWERLNDGMFENIGNFRVANDDKMPSDIFDKYYAMVVSDAHLLSGKNPTAINALQLGQKGTNVALVMRRYMSLRNNMTRQIHSHMMPYLKQLSRSLNSGEDFLDTTLSTAMITANVGMAYTARYIRFMMKQGRPVSIEEYEEYRQKSRYEDGSIAETGISLGPIADFTGGVLQAKANKKSEGLEEKGIDVARKVLGPTSEEAWVHLYHFLKDGATSGAYEMTDNNKKTDWREHGEAFMGEVVPNHWAYASALIGYFQEPYQKLNKRLDRSDDWNDRLMGMGM